MPVQRILDQGCGFFKKKSIILLIRAWFDGRIQFISRIGRINLTLSRHLLITHDLYTSKNRLLNQIGADISLKSSSSLNTYCIHSVPSILVALVRNNIPLQQTTSPHLKIDAQAFCDFPTQITVFMYIDRSVRSQQGCRSGSDLRLKNKAFILQEVILVIDKSILYN